MMENIGHEEPVKQPVLIKNVTCLEIELAIMREFDFRQNLIVPNVSNQMCLVGFETDMLVLTKSGYAHGFEIKVSKADLKADFKKPQHRNLEVIKNGKTGLERYYGKFKYFSFAVPEYLKEFALSLIPEFCGLWVYAKYQYPDLPKFYEARPPKKLFDYKWSEENRYEIARLGAMRIYALKQGAFYNNNYIQNGIV